MPVGTDLLHHVAVGIPDGQGDGALTVLAVEEIGGAPGGSLLFLQLVGIVVTDDIAHGSLLHLAGHGGQMEKAVVFFGKFGLLLGGQQHFKLHADGQSVLHLVLGRAGMDVLALDVYLEGGGVEVFVLQLAVSAAVQRIGEVGAETGYVKQVGTPADFFIGSKGHLHRAVGEVHAGQQLFAQGEDLGNAGLVVGAQQSGAVGDHDGLALAAAKLGELGRGQHSARTGQQDVAAVIVFHDAGLDVPGGNVIHHIHMGNEAQNGAVIIVNVAGDGAVQIAVLVQTDIVQAHLPHLLFQRTGENQLFFGAGAGFGIAVGGGVVFHIVEQSFIGAHGDSSLYDDSFSLPKPSGSR